MIGIAATLGLFVSLAALTTFAQSAAYIFVTLDIELPSGELVFPEDINDDGLIIANDFSSEPTSVILLDGDTTTTFRCSSSASTVGISVNDRGDAAGSCVADPSRAKVSGFVRDRQGGHVLLDVPGADHTFPSGISGDRQVVGTYYTPLDGRSGLYRIHGFRWRGGQFETIDFPQPDTYTMLHGMNERSQILGEYVRFDPATNATLEHNWFIYESGRFTNQQPRRTFVTRLAYVAPAILTLRAELSFASQGSGKSRSRR